MTVCRTLQPDKARLGESISPTNVTVPGAEPGKEKLYWYRDRYVPLFLCLFVSLFVVCVRV